MSIPKTQQSIYPLTATSSVTNTAWSGSDATDYNTCWPQVDTSTTGVWITNTPISITSYTNWPTEWELVMQAFRDLGLEAFPEEIQLVTQYMARYKRPLQKEIEEWFPIFARRRIVE